MDEKKKKEKRNWPIYGFLTIIIFLLFMILVSIYYFCSVFYSWAQYSLHKDGYYAQNETYDNTIGNEIIIGTPPAIDNTMINSTPIIENTVE